MHRRVDGVVQIRSVPHGAYTLVVYLLPIVCTVALALHWTAEIQQYVSLTTEGELTSRISVSTYCLLFPVAQPGLSLASTAAALSR